MVKPERNRDAVLVQPKPWKRGEKTYAAFLERLRRKYGGRLPYQQELRSSEDALERSFHAFLDTNQRAGKTPDLSLLPKYGEVQALEAEAAYERNFKGKPRGWLAQNVPALHRRLWRHREKGSLVQVPVLEGSAWRDDAFSYALSEYPSFTLGEINNASNGLYKALRRQVLKAGTLLPDGKILETDTVAADLFARRRKKLSGSGDTRSQ